MTIHGDGSSLVTYELPPDTQALSDSSLEQLDDVVTSLYNRLESDEVNFDTTTGNIEFPFSNGQSDLTGKTTWTRIFRDWVYIRLLEMNVSDDEISNVHTLVLNGLHQKARQHLEI